MYKYLHISNFSCFNIKLFKYNLAKYDFTSVYNMIAII